VIPATQAKPRINTYRKQTSEIRILVHLTGRSPGNWITRPAISGRLPVHRLQEGTLIPIGAEKGVTVHF